MTARELIARLRQVPGDTHIAIATQPYPEVDKDGLHAFEVGNVEWLGGSWGGTLVLCISRMEQI